ncbi:uncharacterized protein LOC18782686 [Prunus persica]|uniref:uncharacterized protein LOC18782686 n=1 Tax=Prunus persica TaxID=3760 RepID=UPI0009AB269B|nr:uncharacterized protein LOC18782686 [Prunus persica]
MESTLKIYIDKDGNKPIFHQPILKGLYASEGWLLKLMQGYKRFIVKDPRKAHLFYRPFSSRMLEYTLYVRNSHNRTNLCQFLKEYSEKIAANKFEFDGKLNPTFLEGAFKLPLSSIRAYLKETITPRLVRGGFAGITRPDRPGLDLSKQPPAVRLNKELDFILTFKLKEEDLIRESGIPYTIVRPCALTEEPAGANLIFDQGDNITGKISREEVAHICVGALESPYASGETFEVKSVVPFTVDPQNPPPEKDYNVYFKTLKDGITGKEILEQDPVPV